MAELRIDSLETMDWDEACEQYEADGYNADFPEDYEVRVHEGDVTVEELEIEGKGEVNLVVIIDGDLRVEGGLQLYASQDEESALTLMVTGSVHAGFVSLSEDAMLRTSGDLTTGVLVCGGGNLGNADVEGTLRVKLALQFPHNQIRASTIEGPAFAHTPSCVDGTKAEKLAEAAAVLVDECIVDGEPDCDAIRERLREQLPVLRS